MNIKASNDTCRLDAMCGSLSRRSFIKGSGVALGAGAVSLGFAPALHAQASNHKTLVYIFLRGAMDGLSLVVPIGNGTDAAIYRSRRNATRMDGSDSNAARRPIALPGHSFGLHPTCTGFKELWDLNKLAIVQAAGHLQSTTYTRSHFDAQEQVELGTPGVQSSVTGWIARHLGTAPDLVGSAIFNALSAGGTPAQSVQGWSDAVTLSNTGNFHPDTSDTTFARTHLEALRAMYTGGSDLDVAATAAVAAVDMVSGINFNTYVPGGGVTYPDTGIGRNLRLIATLIRRPDIGLSAATVDVGGWDTHNSQGVFEYGGYYNNVRDLSAAITAFYKDLAGSGFGNRVAIVMQSEFGRQVTENESQGTDHGLANPMFVIGGGVTGGMYGQFPGLHSTGNNTPGDAVRPTTDFRQVLATVVDRLLANPNAESIFSQPGAPFTYTPMAFA